MKLLMIGEVRMWFSQKGARIFLALFISMILLKVLRSTLAPEYFAVTRLLSNTLILVMVLIFFTFGNSRFSQKSILHLTLPRIILIAAACISVRYGYLKFVSNDLDSLFAIYVIGGTFIGVVIEEYVFRCVLPLVYLTKGFGLIRSLLYSSLWFGLAHVLNGIDYTKKIEFIDFFTAIPQSLIAVGFGLIMSAVILRFKDWILSVAIHFIINVVGSFRKYIAIGKGEAISVDVDWWNLLGSVFIAALICITLVFLSWYYISSRAYPYRPFGD